MAVFTATDRGAIHGGSDLPPALVAETGRIRSSKPKNHQFTLVPKPRRSSPHTHTHAPGSRRTRVCIIVWSSARWRHTAARHLRTATSSLEHGRASTGGIATIHANDTRAMLDLGSACAHRGGRAPGAAARSSPRASSSACTSSATRPAPPPAGACPASTASGPPSSARAATGLLEEGIAHARPKRGSPRPCSDLRAPVLPDYALHLHGRQASPRSKRLHASGARSTVPRTRGPSSSSSSSAIHGRAEGRCRSTRFGIACAASEPPVCPSTSRVPSLHRRTRAGASGPSNGAAIRRRRADRADPNPSSIVVATTGVLPSTAARGRQKWSGGSACGVRPTRRSTEGSGPRARSSPRPHRLRSPLCFQRTLADRLPATRPPIAVATPVSPGQ